MWRHHPQTRLEIMKDVKHLSLTMTLPGSNRESKNPKLMELAHIALGRM